MKKSFEIKKQALLTPEQAYSTLIGDSKGNQIIEIPIELVDEIDNQPHQIHDDKVEAISESMRVVGQIDPVIVVESATQGRYTLLSGRHRLRACENIGLKKIKAVISPEKNKDKQRLILLASNNDRNTEYLPSELAFSFLEQKTLLEKLGSKSTTAKIAEENGTNRKSVHKYIQLTRLEKTLLYRVDKGIITVGAGYELSFLSKSDQQKVGVCLINNPDLHITKEIARRIRENPQNIEEIITSQENEAFDDSPAKPKTTQKTTNKQPPVEQLTTEEKITFGCVLFDNLSQIKTMIIKEFASTEAVVYFLLSECKRCLSFGRTVKHSAPVSEHQNKYIHVSFYKSKCQITFEGKNHTITLKEVDEIIREYIRTHLSLNQVIQILKT